MDEELEALEKSGATETAAKLREKWKAHATAHDTLKAEAAAHSKKLSQAEKDLAKYKADLEASGKGTDERLTKLQKERDDFKTAAEQRAAEFEGYKLRVELGDRLGIADAKVRKRALDAFLADYRPEGAGFNDKGELQGFEKAIEDFKKAEPLFFAPLREPVLLATPWLRVSVVRVLPSFPPPPQGWARGGAEAQRLPRWARLGTPVVSRYPAQGVPLDDSCSIAAFSAALNDGLGPSTRPARLLLMSSGADLGAASR